MLRPLERLDYNLPQLFWRQLTIKAHNGPYHIREIFHKPSLVIPEGYHEMFEMTDKTFQHQAMFNPDSKRVVPMNGDVNNEFFLN